MTKKKYKDALLKKGEFTFYYNKGGTMIRIKSAATMGILLANWDKIISKLEHNAKIHERTQKVTGKEVMMPAEINLGLTEWLIVSKDLRLVDTQYELDLFRKIGDIHPIIILKQEKNLGKNKMEEIKTTITNDNTTDNADTISLSGVNISNSNDLQD